MNIGLATTIAFMTIGANSHSFMANLLGNDVGHIEMITELVEYAPYAERLYDAGILATGGCPGTFDYEVSEEFGRWFIGASTLIDGAVTLPDPAVCRGKLLQIAFHFFRKSWPDESKDNLTLDLIDKLEAALRAVR